MTTGREMLWMTLGDPEVPVWPINRIFAEACLGYIGQHFQQILSDDHQVQLVCPTKRNSRHQLSQTDKADLKKHRCKIEQANAIFMNLGQ